MEEHSNTRSDVITRAAGRENRGAYAGRSLRPCHAISPSGGREGVEAYALDQNAKVHDLLIEGVEVWFRAHGLKEQVRAETVRRQGQIG